MTLDPLDYLIQKKDLYPSLFPVAPGILCTGSCPVERVFSASGEVTREKDIAYLMTT